MSTQPFSRQYLRDLPEMERQRALKSEIQAIFSAMSHQVEAVARKHETRYLYDISLWMANKQQQGLLKKPMIQPQSKKEAMFNAQQQAYEQAQQAQAPPEELIQELLAGLKEKFPDCAVSFQEDWIETRQGVRELKKGILIDWS